MKKSMSLRVLSEHWHNCTRCKLGEERRGDGNIVFGYGNPKARFLVIYDTPTPYEAAAGVPMSGREGDLFVDLLKAAKLSVDDIYVTAMLGCWPSMSLPETQDRPAREVDRDPEKEEIVACLPRVLEIIYRVDPLVIFTMGALPFKTLVRTGSRSLDKSIGEMFTAVIPGRTLPEVAYDVIPLMGIRAIMMSPSYADHGPLATTAEHLAKGRNYATWLETTRLRDARAAGYEPGADAR